jgi:predicted O-methyltransferase YrrM
MIKFSETFNEWLKLCGNKSSIPEDFVLDQSNYSFFPPDFAIQQNEQEIMEFIKVLKEKKCESILEIGLGYYGSTHVLFREYFKSVVTIELSLERVKSFFYKAENFFGKSYFGNGSSKLIVADSNSVLGSKKVMDVLGNSDNEFFDAIFIDGFHRFETVLLDFLIYSNFVKKNGVIAFHDVASNIEDSGVPKLMNILKNGVLKNLVGDYSEIIYSKYLGIGYFIKK